jgi:CubicO group peptidase (beta-lactamase class C family)
MLKVSCHLMKKILIYQSLILLLAITFSCLKDDKDPGPVVPASPYFPPIGSSDWESIPPATLGWDVSKLEELDDFLESTNTRALIVVRNGKIIIEKYLGKQLVNPTLDFGASSNWYWASAGKTLTASVIGIAEAEGKINLTAKTSEYLGAGWTSLTPEQEGKITVQHQLTMTTGLDDESGDKDCTDPLCLLYKAEPGTRWAYHNAPYTLLDGVVENATGQTLNAYLDEKLSDKIGMDGAFIKTGDNNVYYSTPRAMARFGLLLMNQGKWEEEQIIPLEYYNQMVSTSQDYNLAYGYLTWLNGKASYMLPGIQFLLTGPICPNAPADMFAAMGKNGQIINVVPGLKLVVVRVGDAPDGSLVPYTFQNELWAKLGEIIR